MVFEDNPYHGTPRGRPASAWAGVAPAGRKAISRLLATFRDFERRCPAPESARKGPTGAGEKHANVDKKKKEGAVGTFSSTTMFCALIEALAVYLLSSHGTTRYLAIDSVSGCCWFAWHSFFGRGFGCCQQGSYHPSLSPQLFQWCLYVHNIFRSVHCFVI